ncbi:MAG: MMPL family transporter [Nanohaloarchaea archaeon]|nr:MMPL family transporter [Candidatus Nanohaloarchaea archaeon]
MIIERLAEKLVEYQVEKPKKVLLIIGLLTLLVVPGALNLEVKPSTEAILPEDDSTVESLDTLRAKFSGDTTYIVFESDKDVLNSELLVEIQRISNRVEKVENVHSVESPASILERKYGKIPEDSERLQSFNFRSMVSENHRTGLVAVRADTQANSGEIQKLYDEIHTAVQAETTEDYYLTGYNMIDLATFQVIISDFMTITAVSFGAVLLVLFGVFRDLKRMMFPIVPVMFGLVWMLGLGGYLGANLTIISMVSAAMIMGLGIDFGIHVTKKYFNTKRGAEGLSETMTELSRGLLGGSMTTGVGFLALLAANLTGMHALGIFLFTGIISAYIGAVFLLPTMIILADGKESIV